MKAVRKVMAFVLMFALVFANVGVMPQKVQAASLTITESGGWFESAYVEWKCPDADSFSVAVKKAADADSAYVTIDDELIRRYPENWRADALGLTAG